jgi:hypothetical protein
MRDFWRIGLYFASIQHKYNGYAAAMLEKILDKEYSQMI